MSSSQPSQIPTPRIRAQLSSSLLPPSSPRMRTKSTGPATRPPARSPVPPIGTMPANPASPAPVRARTQSTLSSSSPIHSRIGTTAPRAPLTPTTSRIGTISASAKPGSAVIRAKVSSSSLRASASKPTTPTPASPVPPSPTKQISLREQIALKRAEAKKVASNSPKDEYFEKPPHVKSIEAEEDVLGRLPLREAIEKAKNTGSLNLSTRGLPCIPTALFELHLHVTPEPLKSVTEETPIGEARSLKNDDPAWYESLDLEILRASGNDIVEIQSEISLFGSIKILDLRKNKIESLPDSFADLTALKTLDLSENRLTKLPSNIWALPELVNLNISHNNLDSLPFNAPFSSSTVKKSYTSSNLFEPEIIRAKSPCPNLSVLTASNNRISAQAIDPQIPASLIKLDLSENPLEDCRELFRNLSLMRRVKDLRFSRAIVDDSSFPPTPFSSATFPSLSLFDLEETRVTKDGVKKAFAGLNRELDFTFTTVEYPPEGTLRIIVGRKVIKEVWEVEAEKRVKARALKFGMLDNEVLDQQGQQLAHAFPSMQHQKNLSASSAGKAKEVVKESWEIEAEQGLLTEGGKRRARAAIIAAEDAKDKEAIAAQIRSSASDMSSPQYFDSTTQTLKLPPSTPAPAARHGRSISLAISSSSLSTSSDTSDIGLPPPTLPLNAINTQSFSQTLRVLILNNRRLDKSFSLPSLPPSPLLPNLESLSLQGCGLGDTVPVFVPPSTTRTQEALLPVLNALFPTLRSLDLSYNALTSASLTSDALNNIIFSTSGLRQLFLKGNRLTELEGFVAVAERFKGNRVIEGWKLEELDLRDNEIGRLPAELGLLPLDVFLVEGNTFRVPQRRVWEREGTKGLLNWLRGRIE